MVVRSSSGSSEVNSGGNSKSGKAAVKSARRMRIAEAFLQLD